MVQFNSLRQKNWLSLSCNHRLTQEDIDAKSQFSLDAQICEEKTFSNKDTNARVKATRIHGGAILRGCKRQNILIVALQDKTAVPQCRKTICLLQHDAYFHTIICIKVPCEIPPRNHHLKTRLFRFAFGNPCLATLLVTVFTSSHFGYTVLVVTCNHNNNIAVNAV